MGKAGKFLIAVALAAVESSCGRPAPAPDRIYVSDERGNTVLALEPASGKILQQIRPGVRPRGLALSPDGSQLYVAVSGSPIAGPDARKGDNGPTDHRADGIAVIDTSSGAVARVLQAGTDPETFALSPDGRTLFVSNEDQGTVTAVSVDGSRANRSARVGEEPEGVAVTPDGARLFVACEASDHVAVLDARTLQLVDTIPVEGRPRSALMSADGSRAYISVENGGKLAVIATADNRILRQIDLAGRDKTLRPMGMAEAPGGHLFVTTGRAGAVIEIDPASGVVVRRIDHVGARPWGIGLTRDRRYLVTANGPSNDIAFIDRVSGVIVRKAPAGVGPWGVVMPRPAS